MAAETEEEAGEADAPAGATRRAREPAAFFASLFPSLCRTAYLIVADVHLAEEIVMEAFARMLRRWDRVAEAEQPLAYVRRVVVNLSVSRIRRLSAERRANARAASRSHVAWWDAESGSESGSVLDAVRRLPHRQRACIVLRYFDDLAEEDIAVALGCSVGTVKSQLAKGRARLAALLSTEEH